jgi:hypothetical protein
MLLREYVSLAYVWSLGQAPACSYSAATTQAGYNKYPSGVQCLLVPSAPAFPRGLQAPRGWQMLPRLWCMLSWSSNAHGAVDLSWLQQPACALEPW